ncbi:dihydrofolate reductase [Candidatus Gottesmanbacteria bacterium]|nr:dihydrofolate reductase [Candidatus Gottesmanbacteria bacterium]
MISIIACIGKNRELGKDNHLLWTIPGDLPRFKLLTTGHPIIMGRKTFQSIGKPLPGRTNIVISSDITFRASGVVVSRSLDEALELARKSVGNNEIFVIGGGSVYAQALGKTDRLYLTLVDAKAEADAFFPDYSKFTKNISSESHESDGMKYTYLTLEK